MAAVTVRAQTPALRIQPCGTH